MRENIPDYLDGKLSPAQSSELQKHCAQCSACAEELERLRPFMQHALQELREQPENVDWARFSVELNEKIDQKAQRKRSLTPILTLVPAAALVLLVLTVWMFNPSSKQDDNTGEYALTLSPGEISDIADDGVSALILNQPTVIEGMEPGLTAITSTEEPVFIENDDVTSELQAALAESLGVGDIVEASLDYFSTDVVLEAISEDDAALLASALEIQDFELR
ncbi:zf-HC2 domain-containing protein [bacterium]|nr:zf-HC2 domain-containing protein [bacterium]